MATLAEALTVVGIAAGLVAASVTHEDAVLLRQATSSPDAHVTVPSPQAARVMALGHTELAADLAWVRTLIYYGDGMVHHTGMPDSELLLRLINTLDPTFRRPYLWGAYAMTFRKTFATEAEYQASAEVLRRGVAAFPNDWELSWLLGLRLFLDLKSGTPDEVTARKEEGARYMEAAMHMPKAPPDLPLLAVTMRTKLGQKERALRELREMLLNTEDDKGRAQLQARYAALASDLASNELVAEAKRFNAEWVADLPYVPRTLYILIGSRPAPAIDLRGAVLAAEWTDGTDVAPESGP